MTVRATNFEKVPQGSAAGYSVENLSSPADCENGKWIENQVSESEMVELT